MCLFKIKKNIYTIFIAKSRGFGERNDKVVKPHCIYMYIFVRMLQRLSG